MGTYKGSGLVTNRDIVQTLDPEVEKKILDSLTPEEQKIYENAIPVARYPIGIVASVFSKTAAVIFPNDPDADYKLGVERAKNALSGIYRIFLKITSVPYLISKVPKVWTTYHDQGKMWVEREGAKNQATVLLSEYPELPLVFMPTIAGFMAGGMALAGVKKIKVTFITDDPALWKWHVIWDD